MAADFRRVKVPLLSDGIGIGAASVIISTSIALSMLWFLLNIREALAVGATAEPGTVFAMFNRTNGSALVFEFLLVAPVAAASLIAFYGWRFEAWLLPMALTVVVLGVTISHQMRRFAIAL